MDPYKELIISSVNNLKDPYFIKIGAFSFDVKKNMMKAGNIDSAATMGSKVKITASNMRKKIEEKKEPGKEVRVIFDFMSVQVKGEVNQY